MGLIDTLDSLDLSDEVKEQIRREHEAEVTPLSTQLADERRKSNTDKIEAEITALSDAGLKEAPGALKFLRRVFLSDDAEPGLVLLSDTDLGLADDKGTGARSKEDISVAGALRELITLLPKKDSKFMFSDQALAENSGDKPDSGEEPDEKEKTEGARQRLGKITGHTEPRTRKRYGGGS